ncbi:MAG: LysR family transcriptional regulator [Phycisphaeraceae bacterium]
MQTLRLFLDVARCHSFSRAAAMHGITQSAASQRIGQLEKRLGVTLLDRSVRPLTLTPAGRTFLEGVEELLEQYDRLEQRTCAVHDQPEGVVRVDAIYSAGIELLDAIRAGFEAEHPRIEVEIKYDQPDRVYRAVQEFECDLGILSYPQRWRRVGVVPLRNEVMSVVCGPRHPLADAGKVQAGDLEGMEMVTFDEELPAGRRIRQYLRKQGVSPEVANSFDNIDTIKHVVAVTNRYAILPRRTALREASAGVLRIVELEPTLVRPIGVIYRRQRSGDGFTPAVQAFVDYLSQHAGPSVENVATPA